MVHLDQLVKRACVGVVGMQLRGHAAIGFHHVPRPPRHVPAQGLRRRQGGALLGLCLKGLANSKAVDGEPALRGALVYAKAHSALLSPQVVHRRCLEPNESTV